MDRPKVIILVLVWVMRSRVSFLAALFKETAHCLGSIPALFLQPIITFLFLVLFFAFWSFVVVCMATANYPGISPRQNFLINGSQGLKDSFEIKANHANDNTTMRTFFLESIEFSPMWIKSMWWMCLICLIWGSEFILGCQQMTIAGAVSHWYFRLETQANKGSDCAKCGLKCCICCFYCLEKFIRYLNHNAYTIITIERCHFCKAAAKAFNVIINNALQVATINSVGDFILFLGKCIVTAVTGIIGLLLLKRNSDLHLYAVPTLLICVFAFFIAHCILSLYEMVVDALFICVCEDRNMNADGQWKNSRLAELGMGNTANKQESQEGAEMQNLQTDKY
ncbi:CTL-like protein 1 [Eumeta japonica]|uniref:Choline transporter-like protein n=1 Tax=Eumeta variegata TaxID=151549 RepID=A0A4C1TNI0_EUMVA|nr:CTL-like protein 1 [Eumeta japonica]